MVKIIELEGGGENRYRADVWLSNRSHQSAYFQNREDAENWAESLRMRILTERLFKLTS